MRRSASKRAANQQNSQDFLLRHVGQPGLASSLKIHKGLLTRAMYGSMGMNLHSHENDYSFSLRTIMSEPALRRTGDEPEVDRRTHILDAAERSFVRAGFHRTTMQDVAAEAGMSPGNLYRYFPSKDALVAGLCERDRAGLSEEFREVREAGGDFLSAFRELGHRHFKDQMCDKAKLCLEIWAEATRNPDVATLQTEFDRGLEDQFIAAFDAAKAAGAVPVSLDTRFVASIVSKLADGLFVRRATATDFDPEREVAEVFAVIAALLRGDIAPPDQARESEG
jgi:TetR/AcrR family transcriptional repressor of uid operon